MSGVEKEQLADPTPCSAWTVQQLMGHMVGATDFFADVSELGASPNDKNWPVYMPDELAPSFEFQAERLIVALAVHGVMSRPMQLPSGETTGSIVIQVAIGEIFVHSWDLAKATGQLLSDDDIADELLASDWIALCDDVRSDSSTPFAAAAVLRDEEALPLDQLVAFLGRDPQFKPR